MSGQRQQPAATIELSCVVLLGFLAWLAVVRGSFHTSWLGAVGIVVLAWIILLVIDFILVAIFGNVRFPDFFPF